jgi:ABC-2 type transport system ATP-binding protein
VFFSTHIVSDIEEICDRVIFLKSGSLAYDGSVSALMKQSKSQDFIMTVLSAGNLPAGIEVKERLPLPDELTRFTVSQENKDALLSHFISQRKSIISLEMIKPSLEEIFYQTKGDA